MLLRLKMVLSKTLEPQNPGTLGSLASHFCSQLAVVTVSSALALESFVWLWLFALHPVSVALPAQDLRQQLSGCQETMNFLQQQHNQWEEEGKALREKLHKLTGERDALAGQTVDLQGEVDSLSK